MTGLKNTTKPGETDDAIEPPQHRPDADAAMLTYDRDHATNPSAAPAFWFVYYRDRLLTVTKNGAPEVPFAEDLSAFHVHPARSRYLGSMNGRPCVCAEASDPADLIDTAGNAEFISLRALFDRMDEPFYRIAGAAMQILAWDRDRRYCGRCGARNMGKPDERANICPDCGFVDFPKISPAIIVAVTRGDELLLARSARFKRSFYSVLAGYVEAGETLEECVRREIMEEVGVDVKDVRYFASQPWPFSGSLMVGFTARYAGGEIRVDGDEIEDAGWFSADRMPAVPGRISIARQLIDWFLEGGYRSSA